MRIYDNPRRLIIDRILDPARRATSTQPDPPASLEIVTVVQTTQTEGNATIWGEDD